MAIPARKIKPMELVQSMTAKDPNMAVQRVLKLIKGTVCDIPIVVVDYTVCCEPHVRWQSTLDALNTQWRPALAKYCSAWTVPLDLRPTKELEFLMQEIGDYCGQTADLSVDAIAALFASVPSHGKINRALAAFVSAAAAAAVDPATDANTAKVLHAVVIYWKCCGLWTQARCRRKSRWTLPLGESLEDQVESSIWHAKKSYLSSSYLLETDERAALAACAAKSSSGDRAGAILLAIRHDACLMGDAIKTIYDAGLAVADSCRIFTHCTAGLAQQLGIELLPWMLNALARAGTSAGVRRILRAPLGLMLLEQLTPHVVNSTVAVEAFAAAAANGLTDAAALYFGEWPAERERMLAVLFARPGTLPAVREGTSVILRLSWQERYIVEDLVQRHLPVHRQLVKNEFMAAAMCGNMERLREMCDVFYVPHLLAVPMQLYHPDAFVEMVRRGYDCKDSRRAWTAAKLLTCYPDVLCKKFGMADTMHLVWALEYAPHWAIPKIVAHILSFGVQSKVFLARHMMQITEITIPVYNGFRLAPNREVWQHETRKIAELVERICCQCCLVCFAMVLAARRKKVRCLPPELFAWVVDEFIRPE